MRADLQSIRGMRHPIRRIPLFYTSVRISFRCSVRQAEHVVNSVHRALRILLIYQNRHTDL